MLTEGSNDGPRFLTGNLHQHAEARMPLHQRDHVTVARPAQQIALPMPGNGAVFDFRRPLANGNGIDDPALRVSVRAGVPRAANLPLGAQVFHQLFFQRSTGLNEQAAIDRFVRNAQALVVGIFHLEPSRYLLGRPVLHQFTRNDRLQLAVGSQQAWFGPSRRLPGLGVGLARSILRTPAMAGYLSADCRGSASDLLRDRSHRTAAGDAARDVLAFGKCERPPRTTTGGQSDPATSRQDQVNHYVVFTQGTANLLQRLARLPAFPQLGFLLRRKPSWLPFDHKHHL